MNNLKPVHIIIIWLAWTFYAFLTTTRWYIYGIYSGYDNPWIEISYFHFSSAWLWALITPILINLSRKVRVSKEFLWRPVLFYLFLGLVIGPIHRFLAIWADFSFRKLTGTFETSIADMLQQVRLVIISSGIDSTVTFWLIIAAIHGFDYYRQYQENKIKSAELANKLSKARLDNLKSQLHPHFLFNTMQAISTLIHKNQDAAEKALSRLSDLLRNSFNTMDTQKVTLKSEMEFINKYIELQKLRFEGRLNIEMKIEKGIDNCLVPNLILQPLVENIIKHEVEVFSEPVEVIIKAKNHQDKILLEVSNENHSGIIENHINGKGVGLKNTRERLKYLYGESSEFNIQRGNDFRVSIVIPMET